MSSGFTPGPGTSALAPASDPASHQPSAQTNDQPSAQPSAQPNAQPNARRVPGLLRALAFACLPLCLTACATRQPASSLSGAGLRGNLHGGQQPVSGAAISLYAAGSAGNGLGAVNLLAPHVVTSDASGNFLIAGDFSCPTYTAQVYLVARGGNPGLPGNVSNSALVLMASLGDCGALSSSTFIFVNEVTTVASAWALAQFLAPGALVGSSATNAAGLRNAFLASANLADSTRGIAPGSLPFAATAESAKLYTLANALAPCVNSDGTAACAPLFAAATAAGVTPTNTLDAALAIVRNPAANVAVVYQVATASAPFQPALAAPPHDWTMSVTFGQCTAGCGGMNLPGAIAIDSTGSVWVSNYLGAIASKFSSAGVSAAPNGFPGAGLRESYGITVDPQDNAWITNQQSVTAANNSHLGSVTEFSSSGVELSGAGYTAGGLYYPQAAAADSSGAIWVANYGNSSATLLAGNGAAISPNGYAVSALPFTLDVALDAFHNAWFATETGVARVTAAGAVTPYSCCDSPSGIAVDPSGNIWVADYGGHAVVQLNAAGTILTQTFLDAGSLAPQFVAIDGAGNVWTSNYFGNSISELAASSAALLSPAAGFGRDAPLDEPYGIAIDASGNLWTSNADDSTLTEFIGLANPIRTPRLGPPVQP